MIEALHRSLATATRDRGSVVGHRRRQVVQGDRPMPVVRSGEERTHRCKLELHQIRRREPPDSALHRTAHRPVLRYLEGRTPRERIVEVTESPRERGSRLFRKRHVDFRDRSDRRPDRLISELASHDEVRLEPLRQTGHEVRLPDVTATTVSIGRNRRDPQRARWSRRHAHA